MRPRQSKAKRRTATRPAPRKVSGAKTSSARASLEKKVGELTQKLKESRQNPRAALNEHTQSLQQQAATADVLKLVSRSTDLQTVLNTLVKSAARLCEADSATIHRPQGNAYPLVATFGYPPAYEQYLREHPIVPGRGSVLGRVVIEGRTVHVADVEADPQYALAQQRSVGKYRTVLGVPLIREGASVGVIMLTRYAVRPFTDRQIELVATFAHQALIAIENARLFQELDRRNRDLTEALEQQTATSEVLKVISRSAFDLQPVLETLVENAVRLCGADRGFIFRQDGELYRVASSYGHSQEWSEIQSARIVRQQPDVPFLSTALFKFTISWRTRSTNGRTIIGIRKKCTGRSSQSRCSGETLLSA